MSDRKESIIRGAFVINDDLDRSVFETNLRELEDFVWHLKRSNYEIAQYLLEDPHDQVRVNVYNYYKVILISRI
jgi:hypothetical protein